MNNFSKLIGYDKEFSASLEALFASGRSKEPLPVVTNGLSGGAEDAYLTAAAAEVIENGGFPLIIVPDDSSRDRLTAILNSCGIKAEAYKSRSFVFNSITASHDVERERLLVLGAVLSGGCDSVVTTAPAALTNTVPRRIFEDLCVKLRVGAELSPEKLCEKLSALGYMHSELVEAPGQYARRGGIVDFCSGAENPPIRVEFFGDEIDRIVSFDRVSQRTVATVAEVNLTPATELVLTPEARDNIKSALTGLRDKAKEPSASDQLSAEISKLESGIIPDGRDKYFGVAYSEDENLFSYLGEKSLVLFVCGTAAAQDSICSVQKELNEARNELVAKGIASEGMMRLISSAEEYKRICDGMPRILVNPFAGAASGERLSGLFSLRTRRGVPYGGNMSILKEDLATFKSAGYRTVIQCESIQGAKSLADALADIGDIPVIGDFSKFDFDNLPRGSAIITVGSFPGFELIDPKIALLSMERDEGRRIMEERRRRRVLKKAGGATERIMSYADLEVGDYVVHANYGIGLFEGMSSVRVDGVTKDYITIRYAGTDKLFVPCDRLELIGKYIGERNSNGEVKLSRMGGADWHKTKARAKSAAKDIAKKLIELYAKRQSSEGFAFGADSEMEEEFAEGFMHLETESQMQAIEEIKADMMRPVPMNRLLLGDVGFGKTEVALRAAFKAIMGGKQVAILVPTTILALQHYETASSRMRGYPVTVEMLSRFKTPKEQRRIAEGLKRGSVDVVIGTHKILSKNIEFRDLGLLIVDEEQRFGVTQKERLKESFSGVDVLTLSATPIPRTLNMAMSGISDMSVLDEAPEDRRPVETYVLEHDDAVLYNAINKELSRGGQVLYLYNNTDTIAYVAGKLSRDLPNARVAYAHGKMDKDEIEDIWQSLVRLEIDILVCTTIIETGVDLPSANTLIIENADKMGLSQLHQLRGRVGRSHRQAYAYFTYRQGKALSEIASKRLQAIREYAEFGAGFKVALRDLEIRGAGNILGEEQHGYIDSVGYDLYVKLLEEAIAEQKGIEREAVPETVIDFKVDANIPEYYIASSSGRMEIYKKISLINSPEEADDIYDELTDRYGTVPKSVIRLLNVALSRVLAAKAGINRVELRGNVILFKAEKLDLATWSEIYDKYKNGLIPPSATTPVAYRMRAGDDPTVICKNILTDYFYASYEQNER